MRFALLASLLWLAGCGSGESKAHLPGRPNAGTDAVAADTTDAAAPDAAVAAAADTAEPPVAGPTASLAVAENPWSGATEPHRRSTITPRVSGSVTRVYVRDGDAVKKGARLLDLDLEDFKLRVRQAEAALRGAQVQAEAARIEWKRTKALLDEKAIPQSQFDLVDARYQGAQAALDQADVALAMARKARSDAVIRAPYDAVVTRRHVSEGEYAASMPPTALVTLEEIDVLDIRVQAPAIDTEHVRVGQPLDVRIPALNRKLTARITRIVPSLDPRTRTFSVILEVPNGDGTLRPGLYVEASRNTR